MVQSRADWQKFVTVILRKNHAAKGIHYFFKYWMIIIPVSFKKR